VLVEKTLVGRQVLVTACNLPVGAVAADIAVARSAGIRVGVQLMDDREVALPIDQSAQPSLPVPSRAAGIVAAYLYDLSLWAYCNEDNLFVRGKAKVAIRSLSISLS